MVTNLEKATFERDANKAQAVYLDGQVKPDMDEIEVDILLEDTVNLKCTVQETHNKILACAPVDPETYRLEHFSILDQVNVLLLKLRKMKDALIKAAAAASVPVTPVGPASTCQVRLPRMDLPKFDGGLNEWLGFKDIFTTSVHNNTHLSGAQKLTYLRTCLTGEAARLLNSIECTDSNYDIGWALLQERYQNDRELFFSILKKFVNQPSMTTESSSGLRSILDVSQECTRALEILKVPVDQWDGILIFLMVQKLDLSSRRFWELSLKDTSIPKMSEFIEFLKQQARALAAGGLIKPTQKASDPSRKVNVHHAQGGKFNNILCTFCSGDHQNFRCPSFTSMTVAVRRDAVKENNLCFNCLRKGHVSSMCSGERHCKTCRGNHHTLLHLDQPKRTQTQSLAHHSKGSGQTQQTMLATAVVRLPDSFGQLQICRALLDGGSTSSFITESCVQRLGLKRTRVNTEIVGLASAAVGTARGQVAVQIHPHFADHRMTSHHVNALVLPKVTGPVPVMPCDAKAWPHLKDLLLADPEYGMPKEVDLLLGSDIFWDLLLDGKRKGPSPGSPVALSSTLGWIVAGNLGAPTNQVVVHYSDSDLDGRLQKFWELESLPTARILTKEEERCEEHFLETTTRDETGRFIVQLPFKDSDLALGPSREIAVRRIQQLERRLAKNHKHRTEYNKFMEEYEKLGHMSVIPECEVQCSVTPTCYIPHHFVQKESSTTTKFRVVFDGSAKTSNGVSLNEKLMIGPNIQANLMSILMRFRTHVVAFTADVCKMYRQIRLNPQDTDMQRIVWREHPTAPIKDYRLLTVTYGTASAPYHASRVLQKLAEEEEEDFPVAAAIARRDFFVDDVQSGSSTISGGLEAQSQLLKMLERGGLDLRKWCSNTPALLESLPPHLRETQLPLKIDDGEGVKTLGLLWNPGLDEYGFKVHLPTIPTKITKRSLLSEMSKIFDPLGWLSPCTIRAKILFQQLWKLECGWDDSLPDHVREEWLRYRGNLHHIEEIKLSRCIVPVGATNKYILGFCDASEKAYGAVVYLRVDIPGEEPVVSLVAAKTRVAPSKQVSLPRLELCGAVLLAQLIETVQASLNLQIDATRAWTDSTVVLAWLQAHPSRWKTFVANRVTEVQRIVPPEKWAHVNGIENPADSSSRGVDPSELPQHPLWWSGPAWLKRELPFPSTCTLSSPEADAVDIEDRNRNQVFVNQVNVHIPSSLIHQYSSLKMLNRVTAWCYRFNHNCRVAVAKKIKPDVSQLRGPLTFKELDRAFLHWVRQTQIVEFNTEIRHLEEGKPIPIKSKLRSLNPFLDSDRLLRVGGRLRHSQLPRDQKHPILIPRHHRLTALIIINAHEEYLHAGAQLLLSNLQRRFWIIGAKDAIRHQIKQCVICTRHAHHMAKQFMGDLPSVRVTPARAFLKTGVDYAGPFILRAISGRSKITIKAYLSLFICMSTRAMHLEVVSSLSSDAFIAALRRFVARRGRCTDLYSDCGTNFVGANSELKELLDLVNSGAHKNQVAAHLANEGIQWHFNPPGSPHFGGLWEAGVKSVKSHLYKVIGSTRLTFEELTTLLTQIEACLNSRPLTPASTDPDDLTALTPGHFLIGDSLMAIPEPSLLEERLNRLDRWQLIQQSVQRIWRRYSGEFLTRLQQRPKRLQHRSDIRVGDMVVIREEKMPPTKWKLGRVRQIHPGPDGLTRVATLRTADGELKRAIVKLCLLPIDSAVRNSTSTLEDEI